MRMMLYGPHASIISTTGAPFLRLGGRDASFQIARFQRITASRTLLVRLGGAPAAPDALLLRPQKPRKNHAVPLGERQATFKK